MSGYRTTTCGVASIETYCRLNRKRWETYNQKEKTRYAERLQRYERENQQSNMERSTHWRKQREKCEDGQVLTSRDHDISLALELGRQLGPCTPHGKVVPSTSNHPMANRRGP